jgi:prevent-host-death family protein
MPTQLDTTPDVQPLTAFRDNPGEVIERLKSTRRPITLTVEGQPAVILQDPAEYQRLLDLAAEADEEEGLRQGLEDIAAGRTRPAREVFAELREEYGIRG